MEIILYSILYIFLYFIVFILFFIVLTISLGSLYSFFSGKKHIEIEKNIVHLNNKKFVILILFLSIGLPYFSFNSLFNYSPPFILSNNKVISVDNVDKRLIELQNKEIYIQKTLNNIDDLTINEISEELTIILKYLSELKEESINQQQIIEQLNFKRINQKKKTDELIKKTQEVEKLTEPQLEAIKYLITQNSNEQNDKSSWFGIFISFPLGVFASIIANSLWRKINEKEKITMHNNVYKT
jgi:hypothetical protein